MFCALKELKNDDQCSLIDDQIIVVPEFSAMNNVAGKLTMSRTIRNTQLILIMWWEVLLSHAGSSHGVWEKKISEQKSKQMKIDRINFMSWTSEFDRRKSPENFSLAGWHLVKLSSWMFCRRVFNRVLLTSSVHLTERYCHAHTYTWPNKQHQGG